MITAPSRSAGPPGAPVVHRLGRLRWQARAPTPAQGLALRQALWAGQDAVEAALAATLDELHAAHGLAAHEVLHLPRLTLHLALQLPAPPDSRAAAAEGAPWHARLRAALREQLQLALREQWPQRQAAGPEPADAAAPGLASTRAALRRYLQQGHPDWVLAGLGPAAALAALQAEARRWLADTLGTATLALADPTATCQALWQWTGQATGDARAALGQWQRWLGLWPAADRAAWVRARPLAELQAASWRGQGAAQGDEFNAALAGWQEAATQVDDDALPLQALWLGWPAQAAAQAPWRDALGQAACARGAGAPAAARLAPLLALLALLARQAVASPAPPARPGHRPAAAPADSGSKATAAPADQPVAEGLSPLPVPLAGLVLLHPFLSPLLQACGLHSGRAGEPLAEAALGPALGLLHTLALGGEPQPLHELALPVPQLLLGLPPGVPWPLPATLPTAPHLAEVQSLLAAALQHWPALRNSSAQALSLNFLQRPGLLRATPHGLAPWCLHLHAASVDLLLATLPWPLGWVKLPWMPTPLAVEWPAPGA